MSDIMLCLGERNNRGMSCTDYIFIYFIHWAFFFWRTLENGVLGKPVLGGQTDASERGCARCGCEGPVSMETAQIHPSRRGFFFPSSLLSVSPWLMSCANRY